MKLVAFDGDETLWTLPSGINLSDRTSDDAIGWPDFKYEPHSQGPLFAQRDDGILFALRPEVQSVMETLHAHGILVGVISYNHDGNVSRILDAFAIRHLVDYIVAEWHSNKDEMMRKMLVLARNDGISIDPKDAMLVDDDPYRIYRGQYAKLGAQFCCFGTDISDLREVLPLVGIPTDADEREATAR
jgi:magnesium-dependent phosphatase-1